MSEMLKQPQYVIEGIILRRLYEKRIEGYTIETAKEIAEAVAALQSSAVSAEPHYPSKLAQFYDAELANVTGQLFDALNEIKRLRNEPQTASTDLLKRARQFVADSGCDEDDNDVNAARDELLAEIDAALAHCQAVNAPQIVGTGVPPSLPLGWNDQHAAKAAWMINTLAISPPDEWLSKAELHETLEEFRALSRPLRPDEPAISSHQRGDK